MICAENRALNPFLGNINERVLIEAGGEGGDVKKKQTAEEL
jgi:hypothetical protein